MTNVEEAVDIMSNLKMVLSQIEQATVRRSKDLPQIKPRLVCVSKLKPSSVIVEAYNAGQRHFGENYANELSDKANDAEILEKCKNIQWHFIGHLQTNKVKKVLGAPGLSLIETVHSAKLADTINSAWPKYSNDDRKLNIMIQINSSAEDAKNGIEPSDAPKLAQHIMEECPHLKLKGLMTIGQYGYDYTKGPNPDFVALTNCRELVCKELNIDHKDIELSMGMSSDFEHAIEMGSTNVRIGTTIFGVRPPKS